MVERDGQENQGVRRLHVQGAGISSRMIEGGLRSGSGSVRRAPRSLHSGGVEECVDRAAVLGGKRFGQRQEVHERTPVARALHQCAASLPRSVPSDKFARQTVVDRETKAVRKRVEEPVDGLLLDVAGLLPRHDAQQPAIVDDLDQRQAADGLLAALGKRTLKAVEQEDVQVVMDFELLPLPQRPTLQGGRAAQQFDHAVDPVAGLPVGERPLQLVRQLDVRTDRGDSAIVVRRRRTAGGLCALDLLNVVEHRRRRDARPVTLEKTIDPVAPHPFVHDADVDRRAARQLQILVDVVQEGDAYDRAGDSLDLRPLSLAQPVSGTVGQPEHERTAGHRQQVIEQADVVVFLPPFGFRVRRPAALSADREEANGPAVDSRRRSLCRSPCSIPADSRDDALFQEGAVHLDSRPMSEFPRSIVHGRLPAYPTQPKP